MDVHEERTGIYVRTTTTAHTPADMAALMSQFAEKHNSRPLSTWLDKTQARAEAIRELDDVPDPIRRDAIDALGHCLCARHCADAGNVDEALYEAGLVGRVLERIGVRDWEKYAAAGAKAERDRQHARDVRRSGVNARDREIVKVVDQIKRESPGLKVEARNREAAKRINVSESTVARALRRQENLLSH